MRCNRWLTSWNAGLAVLFWAGCGAAQEPAGTWRAVTTVVHVHSNFSTGKDSLDALAGQAKSSGIEAIFLTDNHLLRYEYGLFPLRGVIRRTFELPSVMKMGVEEYLAEVREANQRHPGVLFVPGVEVVPHYYWTGSVFRKNLAMHDSQKNILVLGLPTAEAYARLPIAGNRSAYEYGWMTAVRLSPALLVGPAIWMITHPVRRKVGVGWTSLTVRVSRAGPAVGLLVLAAVLLVNNYPYAAPRYDLYHDGYGLQPHQDVISYVRNLGGLTVWSMPDAGDYHQFDYGRLGVVTVKTDPYPEALAQTDGYTGFGALYEDTITVTKPGGLWDALLLDFTQGRRRTMPWGLGEVAYHEAGSAGKDLSLVQTILWVKERTPHALLEAMRRGRMYTLRRTQEFGLVLTEFAVVAEGSGAAALSGETLQVSASTPVQLRVAVSTTDGRRRPVSVQVIRSGRPGPILTDTTPCRITLHEDGPAAGQVTYFRLMIGRGEHQIVTNPVFVRGRESGR